MKTLFASANAGMIGLLFFFVLFIAIAFWVYAPHRKQKIEAHKNIPLNEDSHG